MKKILLVSCIAFAGLSCKKEKAGVVDYLSFGTAYGECVGNCATFFKLEGDKIYPDNTTRYSREGPVVFNTTALSNDKYLLAKELVDNFPPYLLTTAGQTFGCPDCADQGGIHIELKAKGETKFWHIDTDITKQPVEIRPYIEKMRTILGQL
jgi:hypothetical protein